MSGKDEARLIQKRLRKEPELRQSVLTEEFNKSGYFISSVEQDRISGVDKSVAPTVSVTFSKQEPWSTKKQSTCTIIYFGGGANEHQN